MTVGLERLHCYTSLPLLLSAFEVLNPITPKPSKYYNVHSMKVFFKYKVESLPNIAFNNQ